MPPAGHPHSTDHLALVSQQEFRDLPSLVQLADEICLENLHILEERLAEGRLARDQSDRRSRDAGAFHVEENKADPLVLGRLRIRPHEAEDPVSLVGIRGPDFRSVNDEVVAAILGARLQRGEVGTGSRLRVTLAPSNFAARDLGQMLALLLLVAVLQQRRPEHPDAEAVERRAAAERAHLLAQNLGFLVRKTTAAILPGPFGNGPTLRRHPLQPYALCLGLEDPFASAPAGVFLALGRLAHLGRAIRLEPCAGFLAKGFQIGHLFRSLLKSSFGRHSLPCPARLILRETNGGFDVQGHLLAIFTAGERQRWNSEP